MQNDKLTPQNQRIYDVLNKANKPLSAYDILEKMRRYGVKAPPTVYRALDVLMKKGLIHRLESNNSFVACRHDELAHHHDHPSPFAICTECGKVDEINSPALIKLMVKLGGSFLASVEKRVFELSGICHQCAHKK
jgi:Fur family zinc uptake transcriptional regulator